MEGEGEGSKAHLAVHLRTLRRSLGNVPPPGPGEPYFIELP